MRDNKEEIKFVNSDDFFEHKAQIELEVEIEKKGLPVIQVERPPVPEIKVSPPYAVKKISRIEKPEDNLPPDFIKSEQEMMVEELEIKDEITDLNMRNSWLRKISRRIIKLFLKILSRFQKRISPAPIRSIPITKMSHNDALEFGRARDYVRHEDGSGPILLTLKNKKNGVTMVVPYYSHRSLKGFGEEWEAMENIFKE